MSATSTRRIGWGIADQALSSATNFLFLVVAAGAVGREAFGALGIAFAAYAMAIGLARALAGEPLTVRFSVASVTDTKRAADAALGTAAIVGVLAGVLVAVAGLAVGGVLGDALVPLAVVLPGLVLQDSWRFVFMAGGRPAVACTNDGIWLAAQVAAFLALAAAGGLSLAAIVLAWGVAANLAAIVAALQSGLRPDVGAARGWLHAHRDLWPRFTGEFVALTGSWQIALLGLGVVAGLDAVGALRAAQLLVGPLNVAFLAVPLVAVPESQRLWRGARGEPFQHGAVIAAALAALAIVWGAMVSLLPSSLGHDLLGATWVDARALLPAVAAVMVGVGITLGALCALRVLAAARDSLLARMVSASLVIIAVLGGGALAGAAGAAWGWALASIIGAGVWWLRLRVAVAASPHGCAVHDPDRARMSTATVAAPPAPTRRRRVRHHLGRVVRRTQGDLRRARGTARRAGLAVRAPVRHVRGFAARSTALRSVHVRLRRQLLDGRGTTVPVDRLLLGGVNRLSAHEYATRSDDLLWPSTKVIDGPHVDLLRRAATTAMTDAELLGTPYAAHARACIDLTGDYFGARSDAEVLEVARAFLATSAGAPPTPRPGRTPIGDPVRVKRIRHSDCYQVVDGHHRIALAIVGGNTEVEVAVERGERGDSAPGAGGASRVDVGAAGALPADPRAGAGVRMDARASLHRPPRDDGRRTGYPSRHPDRRHVPRRRLVLRLVCQRDARPWSRCPWDRARPDRDRAG